MTGFERFRCWTADGVREAVFADLGGLPVSADPLVAAARVRTQIFRDDEGDSIAGATPVDLEDVAASFVSSCADPGHNSLVAVVGPSGCGKTFVVRWLHGQLGGLDNAHVIYVPRDRTSLRQVLRMVLKLPGSHSAEQLQLLDQADDPGELPMRRRLVNALVEVLRDPQRTVPENDLQARLIGEADDHGEYRGGLGDLLYLVVDHLVKDGGTVARLIERERGGADPTADPQQFDLSVADLPVRLTANDPPTLQRVFSTAFTQAGKAAVAALMNAARDQALVKITGLTVSLSEVFSDVRRTLGDAGKQLVLVFEDIAVSGGVEATLYNLFASPPVDGQCPLRVVFAATDGHWSERVPATVKTRVSSTYRMRNPSSERADGIEFAVRLIAKYYNIARIGKDRIVSAWLQATLPERSEGSWVPNGCSQCDHRAECHTEFGEIDGVGLYPLNRRAIQLGARHVEQIDRQKLAATGFTPRSLVSRLVEEFLPDAGARIANGTFPSDAAATVITAESIPRPTIFADLESAGTLAGIPEVDRERLYRARSIWTGEARHSATLAAAFNLPAGDAQRRCRAEGCTESAGVDQFCIAHRPLVTDVRCDEVGCERPVVAGGRCDLHQTVAPLTGDWPPQALTAWANSGGPPLEPSIVDELRRFFAGAVVWSGQHLLEFRPGALGIAALVAKEKSFQFANSKGSDRAPGHLERRFEQDPDLLPMLTAALWFARFKTWATSIENRAERTRYTLPEWAAVGGRLDFECWLDGCRAELEDLVADRSEAVLQQAAGALRLSASLCGADTSFDDVSSVAAALTTAYPGTADWQDGLYPGSLKDVLETTRSMVREYAAVKKDRGAVVALDIATLHRALTASPDYSPSGESGGPIPVVDDCLSLSNAVNRLLASMRPQADVLRGLALSLATTFELLGDETTEVPELASLYHTEFHVAWAAGKTVVSSIPATRECLDRLRALPADLLPALRSTLVGGALATAPDVTVLQHAARLPALRQVADDLATLIDSAKKLHATASTGGATDAPDMATAVADALAVLEDLASCLEESS